MGVMTRETNGKGILIFDSNAVSIEGIGRSSSHEYACCISAKNTTAKEKPMICIVSIQDLISQNTYQWNSYKFKRKNKSKIWKFINVPLVIQKTIFWQIWNFIFLNRRDLKGRTKIIIFMIPKTQHLSCRTRPYKQHTNKHYHHLTCDQYKSINLPAAAVTDTEILVLYEQCGSTCRSRTI